jgi:hypothetical protein
MFRGSTVTEKVNTLASLGGREGWAGDKGFSLSQRDLAPEGLQR